MVAAMKCENLWKFTKFFISLYPGHCKFSTRLQSSKTIGSDSSCQLSSYLDGGTDSYSVPLCHLLWCHSVALFLIPPKHPCPFPASGTQPLHSWAWRFVVCRVMLTSVPSKAPLVLLSLLCSLRFHSSFSFCLSEFIEILHCSYFLIYLCPCWFLPFKIASLSLGQGWECGGGEEMPEVKPLFVLFFIEK